MFLRVITLLIAGIAFSHPCFAQQADRPVLLSDPYWRVNMALNFKDSMQAVLDRRDYEQNRFLESRESFNPSLQLGPFPAKLLLSDLVASGYSIRRETRNASDGTTERTVVSGDRAHIEGLPDEVKEAVLTFLAGKLYRVTLVIEQRYLDSVGTYLTRDKANASIDAISATLKNKFTKVEPDAYFIDFSEPSTNVVVSSRDDELYTGGGFIVHLDMGRWDSRPAQTNIRVSRLTYVDMNQIQHLEDAWNQCCKAELENKIQRAKKEAEDQIAEKKKKKTVEQELKESERSRLQNSF